MKTPMFVLYLLGIFILLGAVPACEAQTTTNSASNTIAPPTVPSYNQLVTAARKAVDEGRLQDAQLASLAAMASDDARFEAYAVAVLVKMKQGKTDEAIQLLAEARKRAPQEKQAKLADLQILVDKQAKATTGAPSVASTPVLTTASRLAPEAQRKYDALKLIVADADQAKNSQQRHEYLAEFLEKSAQFLKDNPANISVWMLRGLTAIELDDSAVGGEAGRKLIELKADTLNDDKIKGLLARLERKGWLEDKAPPVKSEPEKSSQLNPSGIIRTTSILTPPTAPNQPPKSLAPGDINVFDELSQELSLTDGQKAVIQQIWSEHLKALGLKDSPMTRYRFIFSGMEDTTVWKITFTARKEGPRAKTYVNAKPLLDQRQRDQYEVWHKHNEWPRRTIKSLFDTKGRDEEVYIGRTMYAMAIAGGKENFKDYAKFQKELRKLLSGSQEATAIEAGLLE